MSHVAGNPVNFAFPVTLSRAVRRDVLVRTGIATSASQIYIPHDFTQLAPSLRAQMVEVWEKINVDVTEEDGYYPDGESYTEVVGARNDGFLWLQRDGHGRWTRYLPGTNGDSIGVDDVFFATPGRTISALEQLRATLAEDDMEALDAMLAGAPLLGSLGQNNELVPGAVLDAYEEALLLGQRLIDVVDTGTRSVEWLRRGFEITDEAVFLFPATGEDPPNCPGAILKEASVSAYESAREMLGQVKDVPDPTIIENIDRVCHHWWSTYAGVGDETKVKTLLARAVANMLSDLHGQRQKQTAAARYEQDRADWITGHGSKRLKNAAARGYRHDGIYRDERLGSELPGFVASLGRKPVIRELVNPSESALDLEAEVLARADSVGLDQEKVRLVFAQPDHDSNWSAGAFVQIEGYLGRHTIWRSVSGERDDIPF